MTDSSTGDEFETIEKRVLEKEEILRKLRMVKLHRSKHDAVELEGLIKQWLNVCQQALQDLEHKLKEQTTDQEEVTIEKILKHLNIDPESVGYSVEDETFTAGDC